MLVNGQEVSGTPLTTWFVVYTNVISSLYAIQLAITYANDAHAYIRGKSNNVWTSWKEL